MVFLANLNKYWLVYATAVSYKVGNTYSRAQFIIFNYEILNKKSVLLLSVGSRLCCAYVDSKVFVAVCCSFYKLFGVTFCVVLLVSFQEDREN